MKLPETFTPDRDPSKKIEEFIQKEEMKELTEHYMRLLCGNTTKWRKEKIKYNAIEKIVNDTFAGKIEWKKDLNSYPGTLKKYTAEATVIDYKGKEITMPAMFQVDNDATDERGYLHLVNEEGPCINTCDEDVKRLATNYFKIKLDQPKKAFNKR
ncbi:MAG: hypothetical protein Q8N77_05445 [Nanoarchaeota archaeon]|nr:hypothetical protein [Nanoarchaeota archaeon]